MKKTIALLPGDGIGKEVVDATLVVLKKIEEKFGHEFSYKEALIGGAAFEKYETHFPDETREICKDVDAILFGSVGGPILEADLPKWKNCEANSLLAIRKAFKFNANFRPAVVYPELKQICPLKDSIIKDGVDVLIVRELTGDLYFGEHKTYTENNEEHALDVATYSESQIRSIAHTAFQAAMKRGKLLHSVDKANVLDTGKLWRKIVTDVNQQYPEVKLEHILVDNCAMQIIKNPAQFDVILAPNMFGDILSDAAAVLPGSLGLTPSASFNEEGFGFYEPSGGSAPDIAGKGIANPIAQILSASMMLKFSFNLILEAEAVEKAVSTTLSQGYRTKDIYFENEENLKLVSTLDMAKAISDNL